MSVILGVFHKHKQKKLYFSQKSSQTRQNTNSSPYPTRNGSTKYPIPANKSTTISSLQFRRATRSFSERFPHENIHLVTSKEQRIPFSRCSTQPLAPTRTSKVLSLVPVGAIRPYKSIITTSIIRNQQTQFRQVLAYLKISRQMALSYVALLSKLNFNNMIYYFLQIKLT